MYSVVDKYIYLPIALKDCLSTFISIAVNRYKTVYAKVYNM